MLDEMPDAGHCPLWCSVCSARRAHAPVLNDVVLTSFWAVVEGRRHGPDAITRGGLLGVWARTGEPSSVLGGGILPIQPCAGGDSLRLAGRNRHALWVVASGCRPRNVSLARPASTLGPSIPLLGGRTPSRSLSRRSGTAGRNFWSAIEGRSHPLAAQA